MDALNYRLEIFEGPLDLLLSLIHKNKMAIDDIKINIICEQYLEYIEEAQRLDMDLASEFIVMASELMLIKSKLLLPKIEEEEEDPRAALTDALWLGVKGCVTFTVTTWLFTSMADRISTGPSAKLAPVVSAVGLYLASQCLMGMF